MQSSSGIDDELNAFVDEFLKINFKKQRAEATKYANELNALIQRAEGEAVARVKTGTRQLYAALPASGSSASRAQKGGQDGDDDLDALIASTTVVLDLIEDDLQSTLEAHQDDFDRTLVEGLSLRADVAEQGDKDSDSDDVGPPPSAEELHALNTALADTPRALVSHARKLIKKHYTEQQKRAERKEVGSRARALVLQVTADATGTGKR
ncbi:hypothetical protein OC834_006230 [Tilletia horrida]|uniref:Uncharacterized protein n=1 Tax=Tilletia horrida TaxID=155126 RepID=A0AAN6G635_9BASI|nr:hypothetical protein OC834_006230 [Tilletia horrida]KAK0522929.1 hypothetical protein OC842_006318 [Tilletia horrida]